MSQRRLFYGWVVLAVSATIICLGLGALFSLGVFLKPIEDSTGWSRSAISTVALLNWLAMGLGSFVWGVALLVFSYLGARDTASFYFVGVVFGVAYGGVMPLYAIVTREYFGEKIMGSAYGAVFLISTIGMGLGSFAGGAIYDRLGGYLWLYLGSGGIGLAAILLAFTFRHPDPAAHTIRPVSVTA